jgi:hypothetical protein
MAPTIGDYIIFFNRLFFLSCTVLRETKTLGFNRDLAALVKFPCGPLGANLFPMLMSIGAGPPNPSVVPALKQSSVFTPRSRHRMTPFGFELNEIPTVHD